MIHRLWGSTNPATVPDEDVPDKVTELYLAQRPQTFVTSDTFGVRNIALSAAPGSLPEDRVLVKVLYVSVEPAMRGWLSSRKSYIRPVDLNEKMRAFGLGKVISSSSSSSSSSLSPGTLVTGLLGWASYAIVRTATLNAVPVNRVPRGLSLTHFLGALSTTGLTAYFGMLRVGGLRKGQVVVVSAAAGATGSIAAQIAKHVYGCYTVGIAGGTEKTRYLIEELGLDAAIDYKNDEENVNQALKRALGGRSIDIYFDNVGGEILEACLRKLARGAQIVVCGAIAQYNAKELPPGPANYLALIVSRASMTGFLLYDYEKEFPRAVTQLLAWMRQGKIKAREHVVHGLENAPTALQMLFEGKNIGKIVVKVADDAVVDSYSSNDGNGNEIEQNKPRAKL